MILALETSTRVCSVVFQNKDGKSFEKRSETHGSHSENLFLFIDGLMKEHSFSISDLEAVLVSEGPGSYTGLRIAASGVKGLLFNQNIPLFGVNTLASFAQSIVENAAGQRRIHSIIDARRKHVYHQQFIYDIKLKAQTEVQVIPIKKFEKLVQENDNIIGSGLNRIGETIPDRAATFGEEYITAKSLVSVYQTEENDFVQKIKPEEFDPKYYTSGQVN